MIFQRLLWRVEARESSYDYQILRPNGSVDDKAGLAARVTEIRAGSRESSAARESSRSHWSRVVARAAAVGGRVSGFWPRFAVEHVCLVGFIRRRLDVHISVKLSPGFA